MTSNHVLSAAESISGKITTISTWLAVNARHHRLMVEPEKAAAESKAKRLKRFSTG